MATAKIHTAKGRVAGTGGEVQMVFVKELCYNGTDKLTDKSGFIGELPKVKVWKWNYYEHINHKMEKKSQLRYMTNNSQN